MKKPIDPKVSVLMLCYNQERFIGQAVRSVLRQQTSFPVELVIYDDCSQDRTSDICRELAGLNPTIRYHYNASNVGIERNFMAAYQACRGEYIAICEGDDYWLCKDKLQQQVDLLERSPGYALCFHRVLNYYERDKSMSLTAQEQQRVTTGHDLALRNYITNVSCVFRKQPYDLPEWMDRVRTYDYAMHLMNAQYGKIVYIPKVMAVYRKHEQSIWSEAGEEKRLLIALNIRELLLEHFRKNDDIFIPLSEKYCEIAGHIARIYRTQGDEEKRSVFAERVRLHMPQWNEERFPGVYPRAPFVKRTFQSVATAVRRAMSRCLPLPGRHI